MIVDKASLLSPADCPEPESQTICEVCRSRFAVFGYEVFAATQAGNCCLRCLPILLRTIFRENLDAEWTQ